MANAVREAVNPINYIKVLTADTDPTDALPGAELWDQQANKIYKTIDGTTWVLFVTSG